MKNIVITGATSGIGYELAYEACQRGYRPILVARNAERLKAVQRELQPYRADVPIFRLDLFDSDRIAAVIREIEAQYPIDVLINNAGYGKFEPVAETNFENFEGMFQVNVFALARLTQAVLPYMKQRGSGHIFNIASLAGKITTGNASGYAASKHAVIGYTDGVRLEMRDAGILVTAVNLGPVATNFFHVADRSGNYEEKMARYMLQPRAVAKKILSRVGKKTREINLPIWMGMGAKLFQVCPQLVEWILGDRMRLK